MTAKIKLRYYLLALLYFAGVNMTSAMFMTFLLAKGLDERWAMISYAFYFIALTALEIPTGAISDVVGRKNAFVLACVLSATSMLVYASAESFWMFALAAALGGTGVAFANGTLDSWFVVQLRRASGQGSMDIEFTMAELLKTALAAIAGFVGIRFAGTTMQFPWFAAAFCFLGTATVAWWIMNEKDIAEREKVVFREKWELLKQTARDGIAYGRDNKKIAFIVWTTMAMYATIMIPNMLWQPHFLQWLSVQDLGYVWISTMGATAFGILIVMSLRIWGLEIYDRKTLLICLMVMGGGIAAMALFGNFGDSFLVYLIYQVGRGAYQPINRAFLHRQIKSDHLRTTVASIEAIGHHVGAALGLVVGAYIVLLFSREVALILAGTFLFIFAIARWKHRKSS